MEQACGLFRLIPSLLSPEAISHWCLVVCWKENLKNCESRRKRNLKQGNVAASFENLPNTSGCLGRALVWLLWFSFCRRKFDPGLWSKG